MTTETKVAHTPGSDSHGNRFGQRASFTSGPLKGAHVDIEAPHLEWLEAAARAIKAAPEMLAALEGIANGIDALIRGGEVHLKPLHDRARAAIAKVEGGAA